MTALRLLPLLAALSGLAWADSLSDPWGGSDTTVKAGIAPLFIILGLVLIVCFAAAFVFLVQGWRSKSDE